MTINPTHLSEEYRGDLAAFTVHAENPRTGLDTLFTDWLRMRTAGARCTTDPTEGVTFAAALEAAITARLTGAPFALPTGRK
jgi:hypothetical protein